MESLMHDTTYLRAALRRRILAGLGLASITACTVEANPGGTSDPSTSTTASSGAEPTTSTTSTTGGTAGEPSTTADPASSDTGDTTGAVASASSGAGSSDTGDLPGTTSSGSTSSGSTTDTGDEGTTAAPDMTAVERCFPEIDGMCPPLDAAPELYTCTNKGELVLAWQSGPVARADVCCYIVDVTPPDGQCVPGRPFVVAGRVRVAAVRVGARGWQPRASRGRREPARARTPRAPELAGLGDAARRRLGEAWAQDAAYEHASVASFAKLGLELMAFGAPAGLLRAVHEAAQSEVRHAELGFALASAYLGAPVGPGPLAGAAAFTGAQTLAELAAAAVHEGCVGETLAAAVASAQHAAASDPAVRAVLAEVAADEAGHAELAYRIVAWALATGDGAVRRGVHAAFAAALADVQREQVDDEPADPRLRAHGHFTRSELLAERRRAAAEVVVPAMQRLLGLPN